MGSDDQQRAHKDQRAQPVQPDYSVVAEDVHTIGLRVGPVGEHAGVEGHLAAGGDVDVLDELGHHAARHLPSQRVGAIRLESPVWQVWQSLIASSPRTTLWLMLKADLAVDMRVRQPQHL